MPGKRVWVGLIALLLMGVGVGVGWRLYRPERLLSHRATRILDYAREQPDTQGYWLDEHTLLLVTGDPHQGYRMPDQWTGKVQRLDTRTGQRTSDTGLTRLLNSLHAEPMKCEPAPGGKWLLWTVASAPDHYPGNVVSTLDGKRHYDWAAGKFEEKISCCPKSVDEVKFVYTLRGGTLMPRIRLILEDDNGTPLPQTTEHIYALPGSCDTLNRIEQAVETFKQNALPQIEHTLLTQAQQQFVVEEKKTVPDA